MSYCTARTRESEAVLIVESEPKVIAKAIDSLIEDHGLRIKMGLNGRGFVEREYTTSETISKLYQTILSITS